MAQWTQTLEPYIKVHEEVKSMALNPRAGEDLIIGVTVISDAGPSTPTLIRNQKEYLATYTSQDLSQEYIESLNQLYTGADKTLAATMWSNGYRLSGSNTLLVVRASKAKGLYYAKPLMENQTQDQYVLKDGELLKRVPSFKMVIDDGSILATNQTEDREDDDINANDPTFEGVPAPTASDGWLISVNGVGAFGNRVTDDGVQYDYFADSLPDLVENLNDTSKFFSPSYTFYSSAETDEDNKVEIDMDDYTSKQSAKAVIFNEVYLGVDFLDKEDDRTFGLGLAYLITGQLDWSVDNPSEKTIDLNAKAYSGFGPAPEYYAFNVYNSATSLMVRIRRFNHDAVVTKELTTAEKATLTENGKSPYIVLKNVLDTFTGRGEHEPAESVLKRDFFEIAVFDPSINGEVSFFNVGNILGRGDMEVSEINNMLKMIQVNLPDDLHDLGLNYYGYDTDNENWDTTDEYNTNRWDEADEPQSPAEIKHYFNSLDEMYKYNASAGGFEFGDKVCIGIPDSEYPELPYYTYTGNSFVETDYNPTTKVSKYFNTKNEMDSYASDANINDTVVCLGINPTSSTLKYFKYDSTGSTPDEKWISYTYQENDTVSMYFPTEDDMKDYSGSDLVNNDIVCVSCVEFFYQYKGNTKYNQIENYNSNTPVVEYFKTSADMENWTSGNIDDVVCIGTDKSKLYYYRYKGESIWEYVAYNPNYNVVKYFSTRRDMESYRENDIQINSIVGVCDKNFQFFQYRESSATWRNITDTVDDGGADFRTNLHVNEYDDLESIYSASNDDIAAVGIYPNDNTYYTCKPNFQLYTEYSEDTVVVRSFDSIYNMENWDGTGTHLDSGDVVYTGPNRSSLYYYILKPNFELYRYDTGDEDNVDRWFDSVKDMKNYDGNTTPRLSENDLVCIGPAKANRQYYSYSGVNTVETLDELFELSRNYEITLGTIYTVESDTNPSERQDYVYARYGFTQLFADLTIHFTGSNASAILNVSDSDLKKAMDLIMEDEVYTTEGLSDLGNTELSFQSYLANMAISEDGNYFYPISTVNSTNYMTIGNSATKISQDSYKLYMSAPWDIDTGTLGWKFYASPSVLYWEAVARNRRNNNEFASILGQSYGLVQYQRPVTEFNKKTRQLLLSRRVNTAYWNVPTQAWNMNDCYTKENENNIMNEDGNSRLMIRISKAMPVILRQFIGRKITEPLCAEVRGVIDYFFRTVIIPMNITVDAYQIFCDFDEALARQNKIKVVINCRYSRSLKFIEVYNRAFDVGMDISNPN